MSRLGSTNHPMLFILGCPVKMNVLTSAGGRKCCLVKDGNVSIRDGILFQHNLHVCKSLTNVLNTLTIKVYVLV